MGLWKKMAAVFTGNSRREEQQQIIALRQRGTCGENLIWYLRGDTLYIEGEGDMSPCRTEGWFPRGIKIQKAVIAPGCTGIGSAAFESCKELRSVKLPDTVKVIRWSAFRGCSALEELVIPDSVTEIGKDAFLGVLQIRYHGPAQAEDNWGAKYRNGRKTPPKRPAEKKEENNGPYPAPDQVTGPFELKFRFRNRKESDLEQINQVLGRYALSDLDIVERKGYLAEENTFTKAGEKSTRYWYGLDECVLRCTPAVPGERFHYQISTLCVNKTVTDCADCWRKANPERVLRLMHQLEFEDCYVILAAHHEKTEQQKPDQKEERSASTGGMPEAPGLPLFGICVEENDWEDADETVALRCRTCGMIHTQPLTVHAEGSFSGAKIAAYGKGVDFDFQTAVPGSLMTVYVTAPFCETVGDTFWAAGKNNRFVEAELLSVMQMDAYKAQIRVRVLQIRELLSFVQPVTEEEKRMLREKRSYAYSGPGGDMPKPHVKREGALLRLSNDFGGDVFYEDYIYTDADGIDHKVKTHYLDFEGGRSFVGDELLGFHEDCPFDC